MSKLDELVPCEHVNHMLICRQYQHTQSTHMSIQFQHPNNRQHNVPSHLPDVGETVGGLYRFQVR